MTSLEWKRVGYGLRRGALTLVALGLAVVPFAGLAQQSQQAGGDLLSLEDAIRLAVQNNRRVRIAVREEESAEEARRAAATRLAPNLSLSVTGGELLSPINFHFPRGALGDYAELGPIPATGVDIRAPQTFVTLVSANIIQPVTQLNRIRLGVTLQETSHLIAGEETRAQRHAVVADVKTAYYGMLQTQSGIEAVEESLRFLGELERTVAENVAQQTALDADLLDVRARIAKQKVELLTLGDLLAQTREQLNVLMGRDVRTEFRVSPVEVGVGGGGDLAALQGRALRFRPEVRQAALRVKQAEIAGKIKRAEYVPDVSLVVTYDQPYNVDVMPDAIFMAGVQITWEPFDWGRKGHEMEARKYALEQARSGEEETQAQVLVDINSRVRKLAEARESLSAARAAQAAARERARVSTEKYAQKSALLKDVLDAQATLADANRQAQQAAMDQAAALAALEKAVGED